MRLIRFILYVITICGCTGCRLEVEAEHGTSTGGTERFHSQASNRATILINSLRDNINFPLEVVSTKCNQLTVTDVRYSNDGLSDVVGVFLNTSEIGQFTSKAVVNSGDGWNVFQSSGQVGNPVQIYKGVYKLQMKLFKSSGKYGIEIDKIFLRFYCSSVIVNNECPESVIKVNITATNNGDKDGHSLKDIVEIIGGVVSILGVVIGTSIAIWKCYNKKKSGTYSTIR